MDIANNLARVKDQVREYEMLFNREPGSVTLLAASKNQSIEKIQSAVAAGQYLFGENYLQEALKKMSALSGHPIEWHFIGTIQNNKTKKIAENFSWVHSVVEKKTCERLNQQRPLHLPPLNICLEVNVSQEISKSGSHEDEIFSLAEFCKSLPRLKLRGLMAIPAPFTEFEQQRIEFHKCQLLFEKLNQNNFMLDTLSMGMTNDLKAAIAEGSTLVRVGTAIFGARK